MNVFTNNTKLPKAIQTVDGPIILKAGETSKNVSKYKFTEHYLEKLASAGVSFSEAGKQG